LIAQRFVGVHEELVERLEPRRGDRWLDLATGTGEVAIRAARRGAFATGLDIAPRLLSQARSKSSDVEWIEGDAQALPFEDASFDVVSSSFGIIFAPDHRAIAAEIARVCRPAGRVGLCNWRPNEGLHALYSRFAPDEPEQDSENWGREEHVRELLGEAFELEFDERTWYLEGESPEAVWDLMTVGAPPVKALVDSLDAERRREFRSAMLEYWDGFRENGGVREPRRYLLVLGTRRG
jgi:SAM-dependent methyltransferase